jgi:hypothetical protein
MNITLQEVQNELVTTASLRIGESQAYNIAVLSHLPEEIWLIPASVEQNLPAECKVQEIVERICSDRFWKITNNTSSGDQFFCGYLSYVLTFV